MQGSKRIILWNLEDLLGGVVEFFLSKKQGWEVVNISESKGTDSFIQEVNKQSPDAVIFCKDESEEDTQLLLHLLQNCPEIKFITFSRENNSIDVFKKQKIWLKEVSDLATAVDS
jgi:hypothetical protein